MRGTVGDAAESVPIDRALSCIAGFFATEPDAQLAAQTLQRLHGLPSSQLTVVGPGVAARLRFARVARQWSLRRSSDGTAWVGDLWIAAAQGGLLASAALATWLVLGVDLEAQEQVLLALLAVLAGAAMGAGVAWLLRRNSRPGRFDRIVRRQLGAGRWALVVSAVPWSQQASVLSLVRASSLKWCAMALAPYRL